MNILIVGRGRIGRLIARAIISSGSTSLNWVGAVEVNCDAELFCYPINHDSTYGASNRPMSSDKVSFTRKDKPNIPSFENIGDVLMNTEAQLVIDCSSSALSANILLNNHPNTPRVNFFPKTRHS